MKSNNINQICQKLLKSLKIYLEIEKDKNQQLTKEINNLVCENNSNNKIENILRENIENNKNNNNKLDALNNKNI